LILINSDSGKQRVKLIKFYQFFSTKVYIEIMSAYYAND
jgi:hypothetical protein